MCEIFGFSSGNPQKINHELKEFFSHSVEHPNGWGLGLLHGGEAAIEKEPAQASESRYLRERLRDPIQFPVVLAHIRYATIGHTEWRNCHPFTKHDISGRRWTMIHNGTIFEYTPMDQFIKVQNGETDSERLLLHLVDQINLRTAQAGHPLEAKDRFALLDKLVADVSPGNKLNLLIYDGELLYVHTNYVGSLYQRQTEDSVFLCTRPLAEGEWTPVPFTTLVAYRGGQLAFTGTAHGGEYIEDPEKMRLLLLAFAEL